jgi:C4-dicarboxylate transporter, DctM subunit
MIQAQSVSPIEGAIRAFTNGVHRIGGIILAAMMFLTAADVLFRYVFNSAITGAVELNELMLVLVVFFSLAQAAVRKEHVRVELVVSKFPINTQNILNVVSDLVVFGLSFIITWQAVIFAMDRMKKHATTAVLLVPIPPFILLFAFSCALFCLIILMDLRKNLQTLVAVRWRNIDWLVAIVGALVIIAGIYVASSPITNKLPAITAGYVGMVVLVVLIFSGIPIGFVMGLIGFLGMSYLTGPKGGFGLMASVPFSTTASYTFCVVPLFILMGSFAFYTGLSREMYSTVNKWLGFLPGGLAMATIGGCAGFAAICGSSLATAATMGTVALPEMKRYKYSPALATGCLAAGGSIGILIPPSMVLLIYGILTNQPITDLFVAGILPGLSQALFYLVTIYILCKINPELGPPGEKYTLKEKIVSLKDTWGVLALFLLVIGGLYFGVFTPTEAAGIGAFGAFIMTILKRKITFGLLKNSLGDTGATTAMVFTILIGAMLLGYFLAITRVPFQLSEFVSALPVSRYTILILIMVIYLVLGCFMDSLSIVLLTVPIFYPVVEGLQFNPIWFGVLVTRVSEMGLITPPVGMNVFVIKGVARDVPMYTIFRGIVPFLCADFVHLAVLIAWPQLSLALL